MAGNKYVLDTHCLIWFQEDNPKLSKRALSIIQDVSNIIYFSQISLFELAIKQKTGKLPNLLISIESVYNQAIKDGLTFLDITNQHIFNYTNIFLKIDHRDPFDRLLLATAQAENATIISVDEHFKRYTEVEILW